ncbi:hypothetical protein EV175_000051 [Coemansia sp. RSA 1933]|nr:hypothetical protein EV175_000051 [Coemansia sp. RSA 1933]
MDDTHHPPQDQEGGGGLTSPTDTAFPENDVTLTRTLRERLANTIRLGPGGNKARRGSTPRTSLIGGGIPPSGAAADTSRATAPIPEEAAATGGGVVQSTDAASGTRAIGVNNTGSSTPLQTDSDESHAQRTARMEARLERLRSEAQGDSGGGPVDADAAQLIPFRVKFVNTKGNAIFDDVYPDMDFRDLIQQVTEKLRMSQHPSYVLMYKDTDDEEIGVACTDNMREMFSLFEPGSRLQLRIVPFTIINTGALDSIANIWNYSQTPNVFISRDGTPGDVPSDVSEASTDENVDITNIQTENARLDEQPEMVERPKPTTGSAVEDVAQAAVAAAAASSAAAAAVAPAAPSSSSSSSSPSPRPPAGLDNGDIFIPSIQVVDETSPAGLSTKTQVPTSPPVAASPPKVSPPGSVSGKTNDADALRTAIAMMGANLALAIDSLGTKLTRNFDQLSSEQVKIIDALKTAAECPPPPPPPAPKIVAEVIDEKKEEDDACSTTSTTTTTTTKTKEEGKKEEVTKKEEDISIKVTVDEDAKNSIKEKTEDIEITVEKKEEVETKTETTTTTVKEEQQKKKGEVKFSVSDTGDSDDETIHVEIDDETQSDTGSNRTKQSETINIKVKNPIPPPPPPSSYTEKVKIHVEEPPRTSSYTEKIKVHVEEPLHQQQPSYTPEATRAFAYHLSAANFAFHSNPYSSSFFKHGFAEADMPSHFSHPCMMASPFGNVCSCSRGRTCSACVHINGH